jgi:hypothetical protein
MGDKIKYKILLFLVISTLLSTNGVAQTHKFSKIVVSPNGHYLMTENGKPFFWLGDTGWLLFLKLNREEADQYLEDRRVLM